jgi:hypothetical protein
MQTQRISQKLLRNIQKFLDLIYIELKTPRMKEIRINMEEIVIQGDECEQDVRMVNSYPSKVTPETPHPLAQNSNARRAQCPCDRSPRVESSA